MALNLNIISKLNDTGISQAEKALKKLTGVIATAFSVAAITNFAKESIAAAESVQVANQRLDQIAKSMGVFGSQTQAVTDRLKNYAQSNELLLATDAEVIKATQAKLLTFKQLAVTAGTVGGAFDRATAAAIDLAAAGFGSAESNAIQLGKALQDPIKGLSALRRSGITFTEAEKAKIKTLTESGKILEAQNLILQAIETQVGGTAAATATASEKMKLAFENVRETVGAALMPAFASLAEAMIPVSEKFAPVLAKSISDLVPAFQEFVGFIPRVVEALTPLVPAFVKIIGAIVELAVDLLPIFVEILDAIIPIIEDLVPLFLDLFQQAIRPLIPAVLDLVKAIAPIIEKIFPILVSLLLALLPPFLILLEELFIPLVPVVLELIDAFLPLIQTILPILADFLKVILIPVLLFTADILKTALVNAINIFKGAITGLSVFIKAFADVFASIWDGIKNVITGVVDFISNAITSMVNGAVSAINNVISLANQALSLISQVTSGAVNIKLPELPKLPTAPVGTKALAPTKTTTPTPPAKTPIKIPKLAAGGFVDMATLAVVGEAGPEIVMPLDRFMNTMAENKPGNTYQITINAGIGSDPVSIGRYVTDAIKRYESVSGKVFANA